MFRQRRVSLVWMLAAAALAVSCSDAKKARLAAEASGDSYVARQMHREAIVEYQRALKFDPDAGDAHLKLSRSLLALGEAGSGYGELIRAAELLPESLDVQLQAGQVLILARRFDEAKRKATTVLARHPENVDAQILLGNALAGLKDLDGAITQVEKAIGSDPHRTLSYANLGVLQLAKNDRAAAEAAFNHAVAIDPKSAPAHLGLANFYWATGRTAEAERELIVATEVDSKSVIANRALATFYIAVRRPADAEKYLTTFASLAPGVGPQITLADFYLADQRPKLARAILDRLDATPEGHGLATLRIAAIEYAEGRPDRAHGRLDDILKRNPKNEPARLLRVRFLLSERKFSDALALVRNVVADNKDSMQGHFFEGIALEATHASDDAIEAFQEVLKLDSTVVEAQIELARVYLNRGESERAIKFAQQAIKSQPQSIAARVMLARAKARRGELASAEAELTAMARSSPLSSEVHATLGAVYLAKGDISRARTSFARALELAPDSIDALTGLTQTDLADKKPAEARARLERYLTSTARDVRVLLLAGSTFAAVGDHRRAESVLQQVVQDDPNSLFAYEKLAGLYLSEQRLDDARVQFEELARRQPKSAAPMTMAGMIFELQNKPAEAQKRYEQALAIDPQAAIAANNLAWIYAESGANLDEALELAQVAKSRMPDRHQVNDTLGWIYYKKGLYTLAVASLRQSVHADPVNEKYLYHLGLAYAQSGDTPRARESLERALKLKSDFAGADDARRVLKKLATDGDAFLAPPVDPGDRRRKAERRG